ncbi:MAG TPA: OmpA family protein [Stellaceae bacterium]|nr:OmpA family protein [Stellaceae bacterium]
MKSGLAFGWEDRRVSAAIFGDALGVAVLALCLLAVALPLVGTAYLDRYRDAGAPLPAAKLRLSPALSQPNAPALAPSKLAETRSGASAAGSDATGAAVLAAPAPLPAETPANPPGAAADQIVGIAFPQGSARLPSDHRGDLVDIATLYRVHGGTIRIVGYGEGSGARDPAQQLASVTLALDRAKAVALALAQLGVSPADLRVEAAPPQSDGAGADVYVTRS